MAERPNLGLQIQNIPRGAQRKMFIAPPEFSVVKMDLGQADARGVSLLANDPCMIELYAETGKFYLRHYPEREPEGREAKDPYSFLAFHLLGYVIRDAKDPVRQFKKKFVHATHYRGQPLRMRDEMAKELGPQFIYTVMEKVGKAREQPNRFILGAQEGYFTLCPNIRRFWWPRVENALLRSRELQTPDGHVRRFTENRVDNKLINDAIGHGPQHLTGEATNRGLRKIHWRLVRQRPHDLHIAAQVHDEIVCFVRTDKLAELIPLLYETFSSVAHFTFKGNEIRIPVELQYGPSWGELTEWAPGQEIEK